MTPFRAIERLGLWFALLAVGCVPIVRAAEHRLERKLERDGLRHHITDVDEARVEYWVGRGGQPVVLLHGFGPSAPWQWSEQVDALAPRYRLLVPNLLWFGRSVDNRRSFGLDRQVEVMAALMDRLGFSDAAVVGASYGGLAAYRLAVARPDLVGRLVLIDSPGTEFDRDDHAALLARHHVQSLVDLFLPADARGVERLTELAYYDDRPVPDCLEKAVVEVLYDRHRQQKAALLGSLVADIEAWSDLPVPRQPALVVWGEHDTVFLLGQGRVLARKLGAELVVVPRARHAPNIEHPDLVNARLLQWLATTR